MLVDECSTMTVLVVVFMFILSPGGGQRTYQRTCECEYMVDGKCAYTLLLPTSSQAQTLCDTSTQIPQDLEGSVWSTLSRLTTNVSQMALWSGEQSRMLNHVQSSIISLQETTISLKDSIQQPTSSNANVDVTLLNTQVQQQNMSITLVQGAIQRLDDTVSALQKSVSDIQQHASTLSTNIERIESELSTAVGKVKEQEQRISALVETAYQIEDRFGGQLCSQKGLIISGSHNHSIPDSSIQTSSNFDHDHGPEKSRIFFEGSPGAWCPSEYHMLLILISAEGIRMFGLCLTFS